jgi:hypothetical protein
MNDIRTKRHTGLGLSLAAAQEQFSKACVLATVSLAGCLVAEPKPDDDSIDWTWSCRLVPRRPKLDLQVSGNRATACCTIGLRRPAAASRGAPATRASLLCPFGRPNRPGWESAPLPGKRSGPFLLISRGAPERNRLAPAMLVT